MTGDEGVHVFQFVKAGEAPTMSASGTAGIGRTGECLERIP